MPSCHGDVRPHFLFCDAKQEALQKGLANKIPKAVAACADVILQAIGCAPLLVLCNFFCSPPCEWVKATAPLGLSLSSDACKSPSRPHSLYLGNVRGIFSPRASAAGLVSRGRSRAALQCTAPGPQILLMLTSPFHARAFGVRVIKPSPVLKAVGPLFDHKDSTVRDKAKDIAVSPPPGGTVSRKQHLSVPLPVVSSCLPTLKPYNCFCVCFCHVSVVWCDLVCGLSYAFSFPGGAHPLDGSGRCQARPD